MQLKIFSLCLKNCPCVTTKFPVFSLSGKSKDQIPCFPRFPCAVDTLLSDPSDQMEVGGFSFLPVLMYYGLAHSLHRMKDACDDRTFTWYYIYMVGKNATLSTIIRYRMEQRRLFPNTSDKMANCS